MCELAEEKKNYENARAIENTVKEFLFHSLSKSNALPMCDLGREGLEKTPERVRKAWEYFLSGYTEDPAEILKTFEDGAKNYDEMVTVKDIPFYSMCEHHLLPFFGHVTIAYIPKGKIVGLSKLARLVEVFCRRLQVQERMTCQIANALQECLQPEGVGVYVKARHLCMEARGIEKQGHITMTTAFRGVFRKEMDPASEFLSICHNG